MENVLTNYKDYLVICENGEKRISIRLILDSEMRFHEVQHIVSCFLFRYKIPHTERFLRYFGGKWGNRNDTFMFQVIGFLEFEFILKRLSTPITEFVDYFGFASHLGFGTFVPKEASKPESVIHDWDSLLSTNARLLARIDKNGNLVCSFYTEKLLHNSHNHLYYTTFDMKEDIDCNIPIFGAFYMLLYGNSCKPLLVIYGTSSDYPISSLGTEQLELYRRLFDNLCKSKEWELVWKV